MTRIDAALSVPGFDMTKDSRRVVFTSTQEPRQTVIWRITPAELSSHAASLRRGTRGVWGKGRAPGEYLLAVHVQEALDTFDGVRGEMVLQRGSLVIHALD